jgi:hypothetical protein
MYSGFKGKMDWELNLKDNGCGFITFLEIPSAKLLLPIRIPYHKYYDP